MAISEPYMVDENHSGVFLTSCNKDTAIKINSADKNSKEKTQVNEGKEVS